MSSWPCRKQGQRSWGQRSEPVLLLWHLLGCQVGKLSLFWPNDERFNLLRATEMVSHPSLSPTWAESWLGWNCNHEFSLLARSLSLPLYQISKEWDTALKLAWILNFFFKKPNCVCVCACVRARTCCVKVHSSTNLLYFKIHSSLSAYFTKYRVWILFWATEGL